MDNTPRLLSSTTIVDTNVQNAEGESMGEIKDLMIDWNKGKVAYAVLSFGGFLGLGDKYFAVPIQAFDFDPHSTDKKIVLNQDKEFLKNSPGFDKDHWPTSADHKFTKEVHTYYHIEDTF